MSLFRVSYHCSLTSFFLLNLYVFLAQSVSNLAIQFGDSDSDGSALSRPFGVALLFAGCDPDHGSQLFHMDPSGTYVRYDAKAIGSGSEGNYIISHIYQNFILSM